MKMFVPTPGSAGRAVYVVEDWQVETTGGERPVVFNSRVGISAAMTRTEARELIEELTKALAFAAPVPDEPPHFG